VAFESEVTKDNNARKVQELERYDAGVKENKKRKREEAKEGAREGLASLQRVASTEALNSSQAASSTNANDPMSVAADDNNGAILAQGPSISTAPSNVQVARAISPEQIVELSDFSTKLRHGSVEQLKSLCRVNSLLVSGTKDELIFRLTKCKRHGSPGTCPRCKRPKLVFEYAANSVEALPTKVECHHRSGPMTKCMFKAVQLPSQYWTDAKTKNFARPLQDDEKGALKSLGLSASSQISSSSSS
jgi:hypothetical protein